VPAHLAVFGVARLEASVSESLHTRGLNPHTSQSDNDRHRIWNTMDPRRLTCDTVAIYHGGRCDASRESVTGKSPAVPAHQMSSDRNLFVPLFKRRSRADVRPYRYRPGCDAGIVMFATVGTHLQESRMCRGAMPREPSPLRRGREQQTTMDHDRDNSVREYEA
jgi:hypothetical protein